MRSVGHETNLKKATNTTLLNAKASARNHLVGIGEDGRIMLHEPKSTRT
jgi:hypothetical protein